MKQTIKYICYVCYILLGIYVLSFPSDTFSENVFSVVMSEEQRTFIINGLIDSDVADDFLERREHINRIVLNSHGGYKLYIDELADYTRQHNITTIIEEYGVCYAGCLGVYTASKTRLAHWNSYFYLGHPVWKYNGITYPASKGTIEMIATLRADGVSAELTNQLDIVDSVIFNAEAAKRYGVVTKLYNQYDVVSKRFY